MGHARLSPSSATRWLSCPAAPSREALLPDKDSEASMRGTNLHAYLEAMLTADSKTAVPEVLPHPDVAVTADDLIGVVQCYEYAKRRQKELKPCVIKAESKSDPGPFTGRTDGKGTADITIVSNTVLEIVDYKSGGRLVDAEDPQFKIYALGKMAEYMDPKTGNIPFQAIRLTVYQPARPGKNTTERFVEYAPAALLDWCRDVYIPAAAATDNPGAVGVPSEEACHFCKAQSTCPDRAAFLQQQAEVLFPMGGIATGADPLMSAIPVEDLTPEQLAAVLDAAPLFKARIKDAEARAAAMLENRESIPRWKLVRGNNSNKWDGTPEEMETFFKGLKLKADQYAPRSLLSPAGIRKLGLPIKKMEEITKKIVTSPGGLTLAPATDPREDACPTNLFGPVTYEAQVQAASEAQPQPMDLSFLGL